MNENFKNIIKAIFLGNYNAVDFKAKNEAINQHYASEMQESLTDGFGSNLDDLEPKSQAFKKLQQLNSNVVEFQNAKQLHFIAKLQKLPTTNQKDFLVRATNLYNAYYNTYHHAERIIIARQARQAERWLEMQEQAALYPNIIYKAVIDGRTRDQHREWHNIIRPINDPFWQTHYPPNGWGCRCAARPTDEKTTAIPVGVKQPDSKIFYHNSGETGQVFNTKHPYFN